MKQTIRLTESDLHRIIKESVKQVLSEAFKSQKLVAMANQHGGIRGGNKHGNGEASAWLDGNNLSLAELTDDMIGDEVLNGNGSRNVDNAVNFNDGTYVPITNLQAARQMQQTWNDSQDEKLRYNNGGYDYQKQLAPTYNRAVRRDLQTANNVKNDPNASNSKKRYWADMERNVRPAVNKAYNKQGNLYDLVTN